MKPAGPIPPDFRRCDGELLIGGRTAREWIDVAGGETPLFVYDLELPQGVVPVSTDGEVERFELMPIARVIEILRDTDDFKFNVNLVLIDFLARHGLLDPDKVPVVIP